MERIAVHWSRLDGFMGPLSLEIFITRLENTLSNFA